MHVISSFDDHSPVPWANGAGETTELVSLAVSAALTPALPRWRLSVARLERSAAFSPLPGLDRTFLPVGAEVVLDIDGQLHRVTPAEPARFGGEQSVSLVELESPCFALNLMVERNDPAEEDGRGLELSTHFSGAGLFAITLESSAEYRQFQVLELGDQAPPSSLPEVAVLH